MSHMEFCNPAQGQMPLTADDGSYQVKQRMNVSINNSMNAVQGVLQSLTSTVGSAASTVTTTAKSAVNRLTGDGSNGLTPSYGTTVRHNLQQALQSQCACAMFFSIDAQHVGKHV